MELFKDLNVLEILKIGAIGLGFLLALMSYNLIKKEQEKPKPSTIVLKSAKGFMIFSVILVTLGILSEFIKTKPNLRVRLGNTEIQLNEVSYASASSLDTKNYFINSEFGFAFKKPNTNWSDIESSKGIAGLLKVMSAKSEFLTEKSLENAFKNNPLGPLYSNVTLVHFYNPGSKTEVIITDSTGNDLINGVVERYGRQILDTASGFTFDTTKEEDKKTYYDELIKVRRQIIVFDTIQAKESFLLAIYPKSYLPGYLKNLKLPAFYTSYSTALGLNADKLVANENQILVGSEITLNNVNVKKRIISFQNKKWMTFTENEKYFFVIEISYSPQVSSSTSLWDDLQETLNSFTILTGK